MAKKPVTKNPTKKITYGYRSSKINRQLDRVIIQLRAEVSSLNNQVYLYDLLNKSQKADLEIAENKLKAKDEEMEKLRQKLRTLEITHGELSAIIVWYRMNRENAMKEEEK